MIWDRLDAHGITWNDYAIDLPDILLFRPATLGVPRRTQRQHQAVLRRLPRRLPATARCRR